MDTCGIGEEKRDNSGTPIGDFEREISLSESIDPDSFPWGSSNGTSTKEPQTLEEEERKG